jgi:lysozyme
VWTIGYGTTRTPEGVAVKKGDTCDEAQATSWLMHDVATAQRWVASALPHLSTPQQAAVTSWVYNVGIGAAAKSKLVKQLKANPSHERVSTLWRQWVYAKQKKLAGLVLRREAEIKLFNS